MNWTDRCKECLGKGEILCPVCKGTRKDPRNASKACGHCNGKGHIMCDVCYGRGTALKWTENMSQCYSKKRYVEIVYGLILIHPISIQTVITFAEKEENR